MPRKASAAQVQASVAEAEAPASARARGKGKGAALASGARVKAPGAEAEAPASARARGKGAALDPERLAGARQGRIPEEIKAQLATLADAPPAGSQWVHEIKLDGYRILARLERGAAKLISRNGNDWTRNFSSIAAAVAGLPVKSAVLDGEVAILLPDGRTSFQDLQNALQGGADPRLFYFIFDLVHLDGWDLSQVPLLERKALLERLLAGAPAPGDGRLRLSKHFAGDGAAFFREACKLGVEGVVSKRVDATYRPGRNSDWLKAKCTLRQEFVIGGFTESEAAGRTGFGALLVGVYDVTGALTYVGRVGTGFTDAMLREIRGQLERVRRESSPFVNEVSARTGGKARWVEPVMVAEVEFTEWTADGHIRHPSFRGLRFDKPAVMIVREQAKAPEPRRARGKR